MNPRHKIRNKVNEQWSGREAVIREYSVVVEKAYPGTSDLMAGVVRMHWDTVAEQSVLDMLKHGGLNGAPVTVNQNTVGSILRKLAVRKPEFAVDLKKLKNA